MSRFYLLTTAVLSRTKAKAKAESTNPVVKNAKIWWKRVFQKWSNNLKEINDQVIHLLWKMLRLLLKLQTSFHIHRRIFWQSNVELVPIGKIWQQKMATSYKKKGKYFFKCTTQSFHFCIIQGDISNYLHLCVSSIAFYWKFATWVQRNGVGRPGQGFFWHSSS